MTPGNDRLNRSIGWWLAGWAAMVALTVVVGGVTRLTESGLSITEWRPASGIVPPLGAAEWEAEFTRYREIPQFKVLNPDMTLAGFKRIYFWEYGHRVLARLVGVVLAVPLLLGWARGWFTPRLRRRLVGMLILTALQGILGWYMVKSGLVNRTSVSQYRLAAHLGLALALYCLTLWTAADLLGTRRAALPASIRRHAVGTTALVFLAALAGALVAGTDAGKVYNEFPLMAGRLVPDGYWSLSPWYQNPFENVVAIQFNHRVLAVVTSASVVILAIRLVRATTALTGLAAALAVAVAAQFALGILTLLRSVPIPLAALHQAGAVVLLGVCLLAAWRSSRDERVGPSETAPLADRSPSVAPA